MSLNRDRQGGFDCSLAMLELVASLVVDLSDQRLTVYNSKGYTKYGSTTMYERTYTVPRVPFTMCVSAHEAICLHAAP